MLGDKATKDNDVFAISTWREKRILVASEISFSAIWIAAIYIEIRGVRTCLTRFT